MKRLVLSALLLGFLFSLPGCEATDPRRYEGENQGSIPWNAPMKEEKQFDLNPSFNW